MMDARAPITIMLVDDHELLREALVALLERRFAFRVVAAAADAEAALAHFEQHRPEVTLLHMHPHSTTGLDVLSALRPRFPEARFLVIAAGNGDDDLVRAIRGGAGGFVPTSASGDDLARALARVHESGAHLGADAATQLVLNPGRLALSRQQWEVMRLVADGKSNKEIAAALALEQSTVKSYLVQVFTKLGVRTRSQAIVRAVRGGLIDLDRRGTGAGTDDHRGTAGPDGVPSVTNGARGRATNRS
jgi:DNA-binding NarL/FixJ family response regulator